MSAPNARFKPGDRIIIARGPGADLAGVVVQPRGPCQDYEVWVIFDREPGVRYCAHVAGLDLGGSDHAAGLERNRAALHFSATRGTVGIENQTHNFESVRSWALVIGLELRAGPDGSAPRNADQLNVTVRHLTATIADT